MRGSLGDGPLSRSLLVPAIGASGEWVEFLAGDVDIGDDLQNTNRS